MSSTQYMKCLIAKAGVGSVQVLHNSTAELHGCGKTHAKGGGGVLGNRFSRFILKA